MKKLIYALAAFIAVCAAMLPACSSGDNRGTFCFLSVRLKGNGDGTVTAAAINEFSLGGEMPVTLYLYRSETFADGTEEMQLEDKISSDELAMTDKLEITCDVRGGGYFCAKAEYTADGETRYILSDVVHYDARGERL